MSNVDALRALDRIAEDGISPVEARELLATLPRDMDEGAAARLYGALRAWTWKALNQRRRDDELREWVDLFRRARVRIRSVPNRQHQLETLAELLTESIAVAVRLPVEEVIAKRHVAETLLLLGDRDGSPLSKKQLMTALGVEQSNLWRVVKLLEPTGLVEVQWNGRERRYSLSRSGQIEADRIRSMRAREEGDAVGEETGAHRLLTDDGGSPEEGVITALEEELRSLADGDEDDARRIAKPAFAESFAKNLITAADKKLNVFSVSPITNVNVANENEPTVSSRSFAGCFADG